MSKNYKKSFSWHFPAYGWVMHLICNNVIHLIVHAPVWLAVRCERRSPVQLSSLLIFLELDFLGNITCLSNDFQTMLFLFFSALCEWGGWVLKSAENSTFFFLKPSLLSHLLKVHYSILYFFHGSGCQAVLPFVFDPLPLPWESLKMKIQNT